MTFAELLTEAIKETGKNMKQISETLGIPYRTMQDWRAGRRTPNEYTQRSVIEQIRKYKIGEMGNPVIKTSRKVKAPNR